MLFKALYTRSTGPRQIQRQIVARMSTIERALPSSQAAQHLFHRNTMGQESQDDISVCKIKQILEDYTQENFKQTLPSRFKKEIVVAIDPDRDGYVSVDDLDQFIINIGMTGRISKTEVQQAFSQLGLKCQRQSQPEEAQQQQLAAYASLLPVQEVIDLLQIPSGNKA
jgi:hypothetical protein